MIDFLSNTSISEFRKSLKKEFSEYLDIESARYDRNDCIKIDLHCHDLNSDIPDELWGRILGLPETWLKTKKLVKRLLKNDCDLITVTNHNNARSCWQLQEAGKDVLVAAEFTCYFPEYNLFVHVLTYGFSIEQEVILNKKRRNIYQFLEYTAQMNLPVILPHPLFFYTRNDKIDVSLFEKLAVLFQRFEVLNGQRDQWQSVLTLNWVRGLTEAKIRAYAKKHDLNPEDYGVNPAEPKVLTGGSDDHMGIFAGECGSYLYVPNLKEKLKTTKRSVLALEAIRQGNISPFGYVGENQKLNIALLDYFAQVATKIKDPGLLRIMFHRGEVSDKVACFAISNLLLEMQKHKHTRKFFDFVHDALQGKKPSKLIKWKVKKDYRFCIDYLEQIADSRKKTPEEFVSTVNTAVPELFSALNKLIIKRIQGSMDGSILSKLSRFSTEEITRNFEIPSQISELLFSGESRSSSMSGVNVAKLLDSLSFPILVSIILLGTTLASTRLLYQNRRFLNDFSDYIGKNKHPKRALYLTDTLFDKNGVSNSLSGKLREIQRTDMPIDFLICHSDAKPQAHLHVVKPLAQFSLPEFGEQEFRVPDLMQVSKIFYEGGYDRVICSTEGPMAMVSLFLKHMFNVPSYFFMHTDWLEFIKDTTDLTEHERNRVRRLLRVFYKQYSGVFVLNEDHRKWLLGHEMQLSEGSVYLTAHHTAETDESIQKLSKSMLFDGATNNTPVLLYASRISKEKGVFDLPDIYSQVKQMYPNVKLVIAGSGPAESELKKLLPDALFLGWLDKKRLHQLYASLDLMIFPSRFDTFGNVVLEALTYAMPVVAYNCKGPKSIIEHGVSGYLVENKMQMSLQVCEYLYMLDKQQQKIMAIKSNAQQRSKAYQAEAIMRKFLIDLGLRQDIGSVEELKLTRSVA